MSSKTRSNYGTGLKKCLNPEKCICFECKDKRKKGRGESVRNKQ